jgi:DNA-binding NtrC family response regulator
MLTRLGYRVLLASTGEEAISHVENQKVDLVILDMVMTPGLSGLETFEKIILIDPEIKAIIASGYSMTENVVKAQALGAGEYIKKPYSLEKLGLSIKKELSGRNQKT